MGDFKLDLPAPYLREIYLREDFDLNETGVAPSNLRQHVAEPLERETPAATASNDDTLLSDEEFLESLLTPLENTASSRNADLDSPQHPVEADTLSHGNTTGTSGGKPDNRRRRDRFPFNLPWVNGLHLYFDTAVTFFVGENGSGKSTLIEAIASRCRFPVGGGGSNELAEQIGPEQDSELAQSLISHFSKRHRDGYFFRAEFYASFASLLDERDLDPDFRDDPYQRYGGQSLHTRSHGESFLALLQNRFNEGMFLMDEPESALSPQRQLTLLAMIADRVSNGKSQFIIATHSPILMTFPGATIINFDSGTLETIPFEETEHYHLTRGILENPAMYWKHLVAGISADDSE